MEQQKTSPEVWYEKTWLVTLLCIVFFPLGLYALWKNSSISKGWKIGVSVILALFVVLSLASDPPAAGEIASNETVDAASESSSKYEVVKVEDDRGHIYCRVTIGDMYSREALIEIARSLREKYQAEGKFVVHYYYRKYTDKTSPIAGVAYLEECGHCTYKDKEGDSVDFPFYYLEKPVADALRALKFDTAGYKQEAAFLGTSIAVKNIILSSKTSKALLVYQSPTGHSGHALVKKVVNGEERFYEIDSDDGEYYYLINKDQGFVDFYKNESLNMQFILEE
jgi:hypothetical protein